MYHFAIHTLQLDTVQDFLIKLGIKPCMHLWEIGIFSLNNVIVRPTKIMNRAIKNQEDLVDFLCRKITLRVQIL